MVLFHFVYKITNQHNGKYYIGVHTTSVIEDGYMGSGSLLRKEIKEFGLQVFEREILEFCETRELAFQKESQLVNIEALKDPMCYNLVCGGGKGVRTVKEKSIYFNRDRVREVVIKEGAFEKYDPEFKTIFYLKNPIAFVKCDGYGIMSPVRDAILDLLIAKQNDFMEWISECWNNKYTHKDAEDMLKRIVVKQGFYENIGGKEERWAA